MSSAPRISDAEYDASLPSVADVLAAYQQAYMPATVPAATHHHRASDDDDDSCSSDTDGSDSGETSATSLPSDDDVPAQPQNQHQHAALMVLGPLWYYFPVLQFADNDSSDSEEDGTTEGSSGEDDDGTASWSDDSVGSDATESSQGDGNDEEGWDSEDEDSKASYSESDVANESDHETESDRDDASEYAYSEEDAVQQYPSLGRTTALSTVYTESSAMTAPVNEYYITAAAPAAAEGSNARSTASELEAGAVQASLSRVPGVEGTSNEANLREPFAAAAAAAAEEEALHAQQSPFADGAAAMMPFDPLAEAYNACRIPDAETGDGWPWF